MSNLEKIQKGMRVFQILSKIVLVFAIVGVALTSIATVLVAADVLNEENQFLHFLSASAEMSKGQLVGILTAADISLLFGSVTPGICLLLLATVMRYGAELEQKTKGGKI